MKFCIAFLSVTLIGCVLAAPQQDAQKASREATILRYDSDIHPEGYRFAFDTSDGKSQQEEGLLKNIGTEDENIVVHGSYSYIGDYGQVYSVNYVADENGFQPEGTHLPRHYKIEEAGSL